MAWNVPAATWSRTPRAARRDDSSSAARRVKVRARTWEAEAWPSATRQAMRRVSTRVLPDPAPARMHSGWPGVVTASSWAALSPLRRSGGTYVLSMTRSNVPRG